MKERDKFYANEERERRFAEAGYQCVYCGRRAFALAHRLAKSKVNLKKYGPEIIHHRFNLLVVCDDSSCNDRALLGSNPVEEAKLIRRIRKDLKDHKTGWWERT